MHTDARPAPCPCDSALPYAALFVVCRVPLEEIFLRLVHVGDGERGGHPRRLGRM